MDCSLLGSSVHGILQVKILEWVAVPFSKDIPDQGSNWYFLHCKRTVYHLSTRKALTSWANFFPDLTLISYGFQINLVRTWQEQLFSEGCFKASWDPSHETGSQGLEQGWWQDGTVMCGIWGSIVPLGSLEQAGGTRPRDQGQTYAAFSIASLSGIFIWRQKSQLEYSWTKGGWTIKKAEHWRTHAFNSWWWCWRRLLIVPWTARRSN